MGGRADGCGPIHVGGDGASLVRRMRGPPTGSHGGIPLVFGPGELNPRHISRVVRSALDKAAL